VIAEVNQQMPRTHGDTTVHVSHISAIVETDRPLLELEAEPFTELHMRVARNVASLIPDGATLQTGIGGISEAVLHCLGRQARPGDSHRDVLPTA
jgi:4-hydroxybutyrate CoA-transferase